MLKNQSSSLAVGLALVLTTALAGCGATTTAKAPSKSAATPTTKAKSPYVIPAILSLTGGASFLGLEEQQGLVALQKQVNAAGGVHGHPIHFKIYDNESSPKVAVEVASPLLSKYPFLLNGSLTSDAAAVDSLVKSGPVTYALTPGVHPHGASNFAFSTTLSTRSLMQAAFNYMKAKGWTRIAAITSEDASGVDGWHQVQWALKQPQFSKFTLVTHQTYADSATSVSSQVARIEAGHPQAIVVWSTGAPAEVALKGIAQSALSNLPVFITDGDQTYAQMHLWASFLPKHLYFGTIPAFAGKGLTGATKIAAQNFFKAFKGMTVHGKPVKPDIGQTLAWDPAKIFIHLLKVDGLHASATTYRNTLEHLSSYAGVDGVYHFTPQNHRGLGIKDTYIVEWSAAKDSWVAKSGPQGIPVP